MLLSSVSYRSYPVCSLWLSSYKNVPVFAERGPSPTFRYHQVQLDVGYCFQFLCRIRTRYVVASFVSSTSSVTFPGEYSVAFVSLFYSMPYFSTLLSSASFNRMVPSFFTFLVFCCCVFCSIHFTRGLKRECWHGLLLFVVHRLMRSALRSRFGWCIKFADSISSLLIAYGPRLWYA